LVGESKKIVFPIFLCGLDALTLLIGKSALQ
jgi:hypothetical protein